MNHSTRFLHRTLWIVLLSVFVAVSTVVASASGASSANFALTDNLTAVVYAVPGGLTSGACESWANACELRYALSSAVAGSEIWAAAGVYTASATNDDRLATFQLQDGVALYGGFTGTESARDDRDPATYVTILSGDIDQNDVNLDGNNIAETTADIQGNNSYHVVTGATGATLDGVTITGGQANSSDDPHYVGGGMYNAYSSPTVTGVTFSGNAAENAGGGMSNTYSSPTVTNGTFSGNAAGMGGGMFNSSSNPTVTHVIFLDNTASANGGGMYNVYSHPTVTHVTFRDNTSATSGGGMLNLFSSPTVTHVTFDGNAAAAYGGGMFAYVGNPTVTHATFRDNTAQNGGGFVNATANGTCTSVPAVVIANSTFSGNTASALGGAIYNYNGVLEIVASTLSANTASAGAGGGIRSANNGNTCTRLGSSLIVGNEGSDVSATATTQRFYSLDYNLVGMAGDNVDFAQEFTQPHDQTGDITPLLAPLANYGGETETLALLPGSPALDAGAASCPLATDQRGFARVGPCDIGAFESQGFVLDNLTGTPQSAPYNTVFAMPLGLTVTANEATEPVEGGLVTFTAPESGASAALTGSPVLIVSGTVSVTATANGTLGTYNVVASASGSTSVNFALTNSPAQAMVELSNLTQPYDGTPKVVTVITIPEGLAVEVTYNGSLTAPTEAGDYAVVVTVIDPNYEGSATGTLTITSAPPAFSLYLPIVVR